MIEARDWLTQTIRGESAGAFPLNLTAIAEREGVAPLLVDRYQPDSDQPPLPAPLIALARQLAARGLLLRRERHQLLLALRAVDPVVLKGEALARQVYPDYTLRPMSDLDLLVDGSRIRETIEILMEDGYQLDATNSSDLGMPQQTLRKTLAGGIQSVVDLHSVLFNRPALRNVIDYHGLLQSAQRDPVDGAWIPSTPHLLLHATLHLLAHHPNEHLLIWLYDISLLASRTTDEEWEKFCDVVERRQVAAIVASALELSHLRFPIAPASKIDDFTERLPDSAKSIHAQLGGSSSLSRALADWSGLESNRDRARWVQQHLFPSASYMRERYKVASKWQLPLFYLWRIIRGSVKLFSSR